MSIHASIKAIAKKVVFRHSVPLFWSKTENWGDALNPYLVRKLSGKEARFESDDWTSKYIVVGSILQRADAKSTIWGAGFISEDASIEGPPKSILAVRGKLSLRKLEHQFGRVDNVALGDPALLMPRVYSPKIERRFRLGVVPHYTDFKNGWVERLLSVEDVKVIDVCQPTEKFVDDVLSCSAIASSSLHGLICADAYEVPRVRLIIEGKLEGGDFKFRDHLSCLDAEHESSILVKDTTSIEEIVAKARLFTPAIDLDALLHSCPFLSSYKRAALLKKLPAHPE